MGFKTKNFEVKKLGIVLPEAYAIISHLAVSGTSGYAEFAIQSSRDNSLKLQPIETVRIDFKVDRNESPYVTAYRKAKSQKEVKRFNQETKEMETVLVGEPFYGWEDDIRYI